MTKISSSADLIAAIDDRKEALKKKDVEINRRAGISAAALPLIRKRGGNMETDTMFLLAKALSLTITIQTNKEAKAEQAVVQTNREVEAERDDAAAARAALTAANAVMDAWSVETFRITDAWQPVVQMEDVERPAPYITDIKIVNLKGRWAMVVKKSDSADWINVPVE